MSAQQSKGEWAGINEGDPRLDAMFMVYTHELRRAGLKFMSQTMVDQVINETIQRLKLLMWVSKRRLGLASQSASVARLLLGVFFLR